MSFFLFARDMKVIAFMVGLVIWVSLKSSNKQFDAVSRIPLEDERKDG